jgi:hypothetical protein
MSKIKCEHQPIETRWARTNNGKTIHLSTCKRLANIKTAYPWKWAEPYTTVEELKQASSTQWVKNNYKFCAFCCNKEAKESKEEEEEEPAPPVPTLKCDQEGCLNDATGYYNIGNSYDNHYYCKPCEPKVRAVKDNNSFTYWEGSRDASEREKNIIRCSWNENCNKPAVDWDYKPVPGTCYGAKKFFHCKECYDEFLLEEKKKKEEEEEQEKPVAKRAKNQ